MYTKTLFLSAIRLACVFLLLSACSKKEETAPSSPIGFSVEGENITLSLTDSVKIRALLPEGSIWKQTWTIDGQNISEADTMVFRPFEVGTYDLHYVAEQGDSEVAKHYTLKVEPVLGSGQEQAYVNRLFAFRPAPGQFINQAPGNALSAASLLGQQGLVSLGAWGGYVVYGFDHRVENKPDEADIVIYGNAQVNAAEPGVIWVMRDENGNGLPDDTWYELAGSAVGEAGYQRHYEVSYERPVFAGDDIPWHDNLGHNGMIKRNSFHGQAYYPAWELGDTYTLAGVLLPDSNIDRTNPTYITSKAFAYGYADNTPEGDRIDLADAVDEQGNHVNLDGIDFIKVQTGIQADLGWLGECSTEVTRIADLSRL